MPWLATHFKEASSCQSEKNLSGRGDIRSAAAISKSWFSNQMDTKRSNVLPLMELVGLRVKAVARAASTADAAVDVYCVCAWLTVANAIASAKFERSITNKETGNK